MSGDIEEVAGQYGVSPEVMRLTLDMVLNTFPVKMATGANFIYTTSDGVQLHRDSDVVLMPRFRKKFLRFLRDKVLLAVNGRVVLNDYNYWAGSQGHLVTGWVFKMQEDGDWVVALERKSYENRRDVIYARCPVQQQPVKERGKPSGAQKKFYCNLVRIVKHKGQYALDIILSRTSKRLPELLLNHALEAIPGESGTRVRCTYRDASRYSLVETRKKIPKSVLAGVMAELNEGIKVIIK